jgi:hypothetical protein
MAASMDPHPFHQKKSKHIPWTVFLVAALAAILCMFPVLRAHLSTPPGWQFTGITSNSPDFMQYRVWMRQSLDEGPLVNDKFTAEPNQPHLFVLIYFLLGKAGQGIHVMPEFVYAYGGALIVFLMVILLFVVIRQFVPSGYQVWWIFAVTLLAGGLDIHLNFLSNLGFVRNNSLLMETLVKGLWSQRYITEFRGHYPFTALRDPHYALIWVLLMASLLCLFLTLRRFKLWTLLLTLVFTAGITILHVHEGVLILVILFVMTLLLWRKKMLDRQRAITLGAVGLACLATLAAFAMLQGRSGLPVPSWHGPNLLFTTLIIGYPLAWLVILLGFIDYWKEARFEDVFLLGWAAGCVLLSLSGPFYLFPERGEITLQIPLYLMAGIIYFKYFPRVTWWAAALFVLVGLAMPAWVIWNMVEKPAFNANQPATFLDANHREIIADLTSRSSRDDILLVNMDRLDWEGDLLWLGPQFPGRFYCGHFYLCAEYDKKRRAVIDFYQDDPQEQQLFLAANNIRFLFVDPGADLSGLKQITGLELVSSNPAGSIFEYYP